MILTESNIKSWIINQNLDLWGPVEVTWNDKVKRIVIIVAYGTKDRVRENIQNTIKTYVDNNIISMQNGENIINALHVIDYIAED